MHEDRMLFAKESTWSKTPPANPTKCLGFANGSYASPERGLRIYQPRGGLGLFGAGGVDEPPVARQEVGEAGFSRSVPQGFHGVKRGATFKLQDARTD